MLFASLLPFALLALAHPHKRSTEELQFHAMSKRSLAGCHDKLAKRHHAVAAARRRELARHIRQKRGLVAGQGRLMARDAASVLNTTHLSSQTGLSKNSSAAEVFTGNTTCTLNPEVTNGPYMVAGEYIRSDVSEDQTGVPLYVDLEFIDVSTCEPVPSIYIDFWHANATGVYSGVNANGNGDSTSDNLNSTFLRGLQETSDSGFVQFESVFPGHYTGRTTHVHIAAHTNGTVNSNGTFTGSSVSHVGQLFFDQDLQTQVFATSPYSSSTQSLTTNDVDSILAEAADGVDPVMEYVLLGSDLSDGLLAWSSIGIDTSQSYSVNYAATLTSEGGVENSSGGMDGMGSGGQPPQMSGSGGPGMAGPSGAAQAVTQSSSAQRSLKRWFI